MYLDNLFKTVALQAKYDDIKKVVKEASEGAMKGILGYTEHQVCRHESSGLHIQTVQKSI